MHRKLEEFVGDLIVGFRVYKNQGELYQLLSEAEEIRQCVDFIKNHHEAITTEVGDIREPYTEIEKVMLQGYSEQDSLDEIKEKSASIESKLYSLLKGGTCYAKFK